MIIRKNWYRYSKNGLHKNEFDGIFLFGIIPIYIRKITK